MESILRKKLKGLPPSQGSGTGVVGFADEVRSWKKVPKKRTKQQKNRVQEQVRAGASQLARSGNTRRQLVRHQFSRWQ